MKLYIFPPSPNSRKAEAIALHLDIPLKFQTTDLQLGEQTKPEFLALNPCGRIPVLQDGDFALWESNAIMQYLASQFPTSLWPTDIQLRVDIMRWQCWQLAHWSRACQPLQFERFVKKVLQMGEPDLQVIEQATQAFHKEAAVLNQHLSNQSYLVGDKLTLADFSVASDLTYAQVAEFPLEVYPHIRAWYERIGALPAWQRSAPER